MRATILYDNTTFGKDLRADWGFSALIEANGKRILFDTGANGSILLSNMNKLGIVPKEIDEIFISHVHFDHVGGLSDFLAQNHDVTVWIPPSCRGVGRAREVIEIENATRLGDGIYSTGELEEFEQSLCIETEKGIVIIAGCSHPQMAHIIDVAAQFGEIYGILGGLHGHRPESLKDFRFICSTHCTLYKREIQLLYPERYVEGGVGRVIDI